MQDRTPIEPDASSHAFSGVQDSIGDCVGTGKVGVADPGLNVGLEVGVYVGETDGVMVGSKVGRIVGAFVLGIREGAGLSVTMSKEGAVDIDGSLGDELVGSSLVLGDCVIKSVLGAVETEG